jgi:hypothetical protein
VLICGMSSTVIRSIGRKTTCGELKRQLAVSRLMSCGQMLKDDHTFFDNDVIHVLGRLRGGMEVNWDQMHQLPDEVTRDFLSYFTDTLCHCLPLCLCLHCLCLSCSLRLLSSLCVPLVVDSLYLCISYSLYLFVFISLVFVPVCFWLSMMCLSTKFHISSFIDRPKRFFMGKIAVRSQLPSELG